MNEEKLLSVAQMFSFQESVRMLRMKQMKAEGI